jgi:hypothetical protein
VAPHPRPTPRSERKGDLSDAYDAYDERNEIPIFDATPAASAAPKAQANPVDAPTECTIGRFNRADGLVALARSFLAGNTNKNPFEVVVTIGIDALKGAALPEDSLALIADGTWMPAESVRRLVATPALFRWSRTRTATHSASVDERARSQHRSNARCSSATRAVGFLVVRTLSSPRGIT